MLSVGRRTRTIPPHIRRALEERDRGCRFPGCGCTFTEAHHVKHWADGGKTSLRNTLLLCRRHHRAVHEGRVKVSVNSDGTVLFFMPNGRMLVDAPKQSLLVGTRRQHAGADAWRERGRTGGSARPAQVDWEEQRADSGLPPVPSVYPHAPAKGKDPILSTGLRSIATQLSPGRSKPLPGKPWRILFRVDPETDVGFRHRPIIGIRTGTRLS